MRRDVTIHEGAIAGHVGNAHRRWSHRRSAILTLRHGGAAGVGEASPLPGYSPDDVDACARALAEVPLAGLSLGQSDAIDAALPAARFALETALLDLRGQLTGRPAHELLDAPAGARVPLQTLVADDDDAAEAAARGVGVVKLKVGRDVAAEAALVARLRRDYPEVEVRVDANGADVDLSGFDVAVCEEPGGPVPPAAAVAADESLRTMTFDAVAERCASGAIAVMVLKPTLQGGFRRCLTLARIARDHGVRVAVSHCFDGPIALAAACELALAVADTASGLDRHAALTAWPPRDIPQLAAAEVRPTARPGLGFAAPDALSPLATDPAAPALITADRTYRWADLHEPITRALRVTSTPEVIVADTGVDTLVRIYACLERRAPAVLLHPRWTDSERAAQAGRAAAVPDDCAVVVFTSGSRGAPRGVILDRDALLASAAASAGNLGWRADDRWLLNLPVAHVGGLSIALRCLIAGRPVVIDDAPFDAGRTAELIDARRVTLMSLVPTMLVRLLHDLPDWRPPAHLRAVLVGGAAASPELLARARARGVPVVPTYGMTEAGSQIATARPGTDDLVPLPGVEVRTTDSGHIAVRGAMVMRGYLAPDPAPLDDSWLVTGDVGEIDDRGVLRIHGRAGDTIITGGENVDPREVEAALQALPGVRAACVVGLADDEWGEVVAAVVEAEDEVDIDIDIDIAPYKRPKRVAIVDALPVTANGKVDRAAARALFST